jgi:hypothetical protein
MVELLLEESLVKLRHFDSYSNSGHEGTIKGWKNIAAPILPQFDLHRSGSNLTDNAGIKAKGNAVDASEEVLSPISLLQSLYCIGLY